MMCASSPELSTEVVDASRIDCKVGLIGSIARAAGQHLASPPAKNVAFVLIGRALPRVLSAKIVALTATLTPISINPRLRASDKLPMLVSSTIAVVIVRV